VATACGSGSCRRRSRRSRRSRRPPSKRGVKYSDPTRPAPSTDRVFVLRGRNASHISARWRVSVLPPPAEPIGRARERAAERERQRERESETEAERQTAGGSSSQCPSRSLPTNTQMARQRKRGREAERQSKRGRATEGERPRSRGRATERKRQRGREAEAARGRATAEGRPARVCQGPTLPSEGTGY